MGSIDYLKRFSEIQNFSRETVRTLLFTSGSRPILYFFFFPIILFFKIIDTSIDSLLQAGDTIELTLFNWFGVEEIGKLTNIKIIFISGAFFVLTLIIVSSVLVGENYHTQPQANSNSGSMNSTLNNGNDKDELGDEKKEKIKKKKKKLAPNSNGDSNNNGNASRKKRNLENNDLQSKLTRTAISVRDTMKKFWSRFKTDSMVFFDKIIHTPHSLIQAFFVQFFTFQATFFLFVYSTTWFGTQGSFFLSLKSFFFKNIEKNISFPWESEWDR